MLNCSHANGYHWGSIRASFEGHILDQSAVEGALSCLLATAVVVGELDAEAVGDSRMPLDLGVQGHPPELQGHAEIISDDVIHEVNEVLLGQIHVLTFQVEHCHSL